MIPAKSGGMQNIAIPVSISIKTPFLLAEKISGKQSVTISGKNNHSNNLSNSSRYSALYTS